MDEQKNTQEEPKVPVEDTNERIQSKAISEIDRADQIAERQKRENDRRESILVREEALAAMRTVGGEAEAGITPVVETEDEKWAKDAKIRYEGTGMDPTE